MSPEQHCCHQPSSAALNSLSRREAEKQSHFPSESFFQKPAAAVRNSPEESRVVYVLLYSRKQEERGSDELGVL